MKLNGHELMLYTNDDYRENVLKHQRKKQQDEILDEIIRTQNGRHGYE